MFLKTNLSDLKGRSVVSLFIHCINSIRSKIFLLMQRNKEKQRHGSAFFFTEIRRNKIKIQPLDALFEVLETTTLSLYLAFKFGWYSNVSGIQILMSFQFEWHSNLSDILIWVIPIWVKFQLEWHYNLSDTPI